MRGHTWRVCVVGPSTRFLSGITYYTYSLCQALSARCEVSAILMRQLLPTGLYPGRARVGAALSDLVLPDTVRRVEGVDWFWVPTLGRALWFLARWRALGGIGENWGRCGPGYFCSPRRVSSAA